MSSLAPFHIASDLLSADILPKGATLAALWFAGTDRSLVLSFADPADHFGIPACAGSIVGPVANRIEQGQITLNGVTHQMPCNENGVTSLHSGDKGLHMRDWTMQSHGRDHVTLEIALLDGEYGLPGLRHITVRYALCGDTLTLDISATTDKTTAMNPAHHPYWTLDGRADVSGHSLQISADHYLPTDARNLPTGERRPTKNSGFDFNTAHPVPLSGNLDVNFCLTPAIKQPAARLTGADGIMLEIETDAPGLQVYAGAHLPEMKGILAGGDDLAPFAGLALEPQFWPNAPHHPDFAQITLHPAQTWRQTTRYRLTRQS